MPKNVLLREPLYFDYSIEKPEAKITLLAAEKQWEYTNEKRNENLERYKNKERFLKHGVSYVISIEMTLPKSNRNKELAKFMLNTRAIDISGSNVASSSRPIIVPYQSRITKLLEGIVFWPLREIGLMKSSETIRVREELMNNYMENVEPTDKFEFTLSTNKADIEGVYLSIFPRLNMLTSLIFYHPNLSAVIGVCLIAFVEAIVCSIIFSVYYMLKYLTNPEGVRRRAWTDETESYGSDEYEDDDSISQDSDELFRGPNDEGEGSEEEDSAEEEEGEGEGEGEGEEEEEEEEDEEKQQQGVEEGKYNVDGSDEFEEGEEDDGGRDRSAGLNDGLRKRK